MSYMLNQRRIGMSTLDSKQYKEGQRQGWDSVAGGWQKWWKITETAAEKVSRRLIELIQSLPPFVIMKIYNIYHNKGLRD